MFRGRRSRNSSRDSSPEEPPQPAPIAPPQSPNVWSTATASTVTYFVSSPWQWLMDSIAVEGMTRADTASALPTNKETKRSEAASVSSTPVTPSTLRRRRKKDRGPATLKIEITDRATGIVEYAVHGTSSALDGMEDKDELVRTLQRCRCDHLNLSPPSVLIGWDVTHEECLNVVGKELPTLPENTNGLKYAVLKEPMGSQGKGIYFVTNTEDIHKVIDEQRQRALNEPDFLDNLIAAKGRIPSWVLQAEVAPSLLIKNHRKFHIRTYVTILEKTTHPDLFEIFIFNRHEIRIAGMSISEDDCGRDPVKHITNGALSTSTERVLLGDVTELVDRNIQRKTEVFVADIFAKHLAPDIARRVRVSASQDDGHEKVRKFAIAGLDIMVTDDSRLYLLEVNSNPAAPRENTLSPRFKEHLKDFLRSLVDLVVGVHPTDFISARDVLASAAQHA